MEEIAQIFDEDSEEGAEKARTRAQEEEKEMFDRIERGDRLKDPEMAKAQRMLKAQYPCMGGFQSTLRSTAPPGFDACGSEGVQIHFTAGCHWVVSTSIGGAITVIDTLWDFVHSHLEQDLYKIYAGKVQEGKLDVTMAGCQKQSGYNDCGVFAIAYATELCHGASPLTETRFDQKQLRSHLSRCFHSGLLQPFPKTGHPVEAKDEKKFLLAAP